RSLRADRAPHAPVNHHFMSLKSAMKNGNPRVRLLIKYRRLPIVLLHAGLIVLANYLAFWLRFDGAVPAADRGQFLRMLPWLIVIRSAVFYPLRLYEGLWRYTSVLDLRNIIAGAGLSTLLFYGLVHGYFQLSDYPRSVFVVDTLILIFLMG